MKKISMASNLDIFKDAIKNSNLLIAMESKKGAILTSRTRICLKDRKGWRLLGLVQSLNIKAYANSAFAEITMTFPTHPKLSKISKDIVRKNSKAVEKLGCVVKLHKIKE